MLNNYTFTPTELPKKYRIQIDSIIKDIVDSKTDPYWKNYTDKEFNIDEQTAISVSCDKDDVKVISTIAMAISRHLGNTNVITVSITITITINILITTSVNPSI